MLKAPFFSPHSQWSKWLILTSFWRFAELIFPFTRPYGRWTLARLEVLISSNSFFSHRHGFNVILSFFLFLVRLLDSKYHKLSILPGVGHLHHFVEVKREKTPKDSYTRATSFFYISIRGQDLQRRRRKLPVRYPQIQFDRSVTDVWLKETKWIEFLPNAK